MTKYQRGELMEGWNDCPDIMLQSNSSSASVGSRSKRRTPRAFSANSSQSSVSQEPVVVARVFTADELRQAKKDAEDYVDSGSFKPEEKTFVVDRLINVFDTLEEKHQQFVAKIVDGLLKKQTKPAQLKTEVLAYMMANSGVSSWAVGLRKFVEMQ